MTELWSLTSIREGRSHRTTAGTEAWPSDRLQALAYGMLVQACLGLEIREVRVRYHTDNKMVRIPFDDKARTEVQDAIQRARQLRTSLQRPPITIHEKRCVNCSLAPVCLPEEERLGAV